MLTTCDFKAKIDQFKTKPHSIQALIFEQMKGFFLLYTGTNANPCAFYISRVYGVRDHERFSNDERQCELRSRTRAESNKLFLSLG